MATNDTSDGEESTFQSEIEAAHVIQNVTDHELYPPNEDFEIPEDWAIDAGWAVKFAEEKAKDGEAVHPRLLAAVISKDCGVEAVRMGPDAAMVADVPIEKLEAVSTQINRMNYRITEVSGETGDVYIYAAKDE